MTKLRNRHLVLLIDTMRYWILEFRVTNSKQNDNFDSIKELRTCYGGRLLHQALPITVIWGRFIVYQLFVVGFYYSGVLLICPLGREKDGGKFANSSYQPAVQHVFERTLQVW